MIFFSVGTLVSYLLKTSTDMAFAILLNIGPRQNCEIFFFCQLVESFKNGLNWAFYIGARARPCLLFWSSCFTLPHGPIEHQAGRACTIVIKIVKFSANKNIKTKICFQQFTHTLNTRMHINFCWNNINYIIVRILYVLHNILFQ